MKNKRNKLTAFAVPGVGLALVVLGTGIAHADPAPTISCPNAATLGVPFTATLSHWPVGTVNLVQAWAPEGQQSGPVVGNAWVDPTLANPKVAASFYVPVTLQGNIPGPWQPTHLVTAVEQVGTQTLQAECYIENLVVNL
ncbi:hypothetical protein BOO86_05330 [Mycobacterium sp. CBMA 234]|uniref:hypothetical protein n=1 Tax=Mycolicibacterium sp. CBMA 234 TaxID=1918495 RepID=UPI0012DBF03D|nr:hypothetical protein [Mycolicibacterium sp. CBMA 234]MUL63879.1 hypothetical protein [Mycolicibacterium sp. CBMA 234]